MAKLNVDVFFRVDASGLEAIDKNAVKVLQAQAKIASANARVAASENQLKIERQKTKTVTAQQVLEEKKAETAKKQATLATKKATQAEKERQLTIERGNTALKQKALQEERTRTTEAQSEQQSRKTATAEANLAVQKERTATASKKQETAQRSVNSATQEATGLNKLLGNSLDVIVAKMAAWQIIGTFVSTAIRSFKDALSTLREVDSELVTIRKVTGFSDSQISEIRERAFSTASAYGIGAADYLNSVSAFARAGYREQAAALAELSAKTQIVGDTTAETANQFLLSVDAAYKYKGNIEELTKVLDGANEIDNKYATSIEKIAEGMGIVAPVAAQMHVTINELAAAIGTITAVTQRSGSEAARALRALFLNIAGDTKTEIDEGVTWTTGEIAGLSDVIKTYAKDAWDAAQATKGIIDPMRAMEGLAKSMQEGTLTEAKLLEMVSDIGGKLRTSQLLAIIQNWDMYQSMLQDYAGAIGSADKEVENALDSWERKSEQLKNTWAEFISHIVETKEIKGAIDGLTAAIRLLDTPLGQAAAKAGALVAVLVVINALTKGALLSGFKALIAQLMGTEGAIGAISTATAGWIGIAVVGVALLVTLYKNLNQSAEDHLKKSKELYSEYESLQGEMDAIQEKLAENQRLIAEGNEAGADERYLTRLINENEQLAIQYGILKAAADEKRKAALEEAKSAYNARSYTWEVSTPKNYIDSFGGSVETKWVSGNIVEYTKHLLELAQAGEDVSAELGGALETLGTLNQRFGDGDEEAQAYNEQIAEVLELYQALYPEMDSTADSMGELADEISDGNEEFKSAVKLYGEMKEKLDPLNKAMAEMSKQGYMTEATMKALIAAYPELEDQIIATTEGFVLNKAAIMENVLALWAEYSAINENAAAASMVQILALNNENGAWAANTAEIKKNIAARIAALEAEQLSTHIVGSGYSGTYYGENVGLTSAETSELNMLKGLLRSVDSYVPSETTAKGGGGGGGSAKSAADEELDRLKGIVSLRKQELSYLEASDAEVQDRVGKMRDIQDALHAQAEYMRSIGASEEDVLKLSTEWWTYQNKITKALEDAAKAAKETALELLETQKEAALGPMKAQLELLKGQRDAAKDAREEEEKRLAVEKARIALENAQNERNVRQYNARTGQWEWVANAQNVDKAREALEDAQKALSDFYYEQQISAMEANIKAAEASYDAMKDAIEKNAVIDRMKANSAAWWDADAAGRQRLSDENLVLGTSQGWTRKNGTWYDASGNQVYDSGGILRGVGGIKATRSDEMILPPQATRQLLEAEQTGAFDAILQHLGIVTAAGQRYVGFGGGMNSTRIGSQHNGDVYEIGGVTLSEAQARGMTVFDLAQMARTLSLHNA